MAYTVVIDPGHGGSDPGATYQGRLEKDDNLNLALQVGEMLSRDGFDVIYTRTEDIYDTPLEKANIANNSNGDFFISFHRNSNVVPNSSSGVETLVFDNSGVKSDVANAVNDNLAALGFNNRGVIERPNLVVLKRTKMPAILIETGFINNTNDNLLFDSRFNEIANAISSAVSDTLSPNVTTPAIYKIQVGAFEHRDNAYSLSERLGIDGFPAYVEQSNGLYRVYVGSYEELNNAVNTEKALRNAGYQTFITTN
ncbi:MAG: N-acetylmuramoyl-L-alanine amidase [Lachnospiraceae bacterium]|nr:N-acetylmuramoyl-L-alanine amidase [Lachnospiraceae bacterium]